MMSDYKVDMINDGMKEFYVHFNGPNESKYFILASNLEFFLSLFYVPLYEIQLQRYFLVFGY